MEQDGARRQTRGGAAAAAPLQGAPLKGGPLKAELAG